jgi:AraC-like DNA-binding protein
METNFLIGAAFALFFAVLLYNKPQRSLADIILSVWFLVSVPHLLSSYIETSGLFVDFPHFIGASDSLAFLYGPFLFFYTTSLISEKPEFKKTYLFHLIPFLLNIFIYLPFYLKDGDQKMAAYPAQISTVPYLVEIGIAFKLVLLPTYVVLSWVFLKKHERNINNYFSSKKQKDLLWLKNLTIGLGSFWLFVLLNFVLEDLVLKRPILKINETLISLVQAFAVVALGYFGFKQGSIFSQIQNKDESVSDKSIEQIKYQRSGLTEQDANRYLDKLLSFMRTEKAYLDGELTIEDVSRSIEIPRHALTQIINQKLGKNFYQFVNTYRVKESKDRILDPKYENLTILAIGFDSGFNSKSTFNAIFKNATDMTPSEFRKNVFSKEKAQNTL